MIRLKQVLMTGVTMMKISEENMLSSKCNKKEATNQGAMKVDDDDICKKMGTTGEADGEEVLNSLSDFGMISHGMLINQWLLGMCSHEIKYVTFLLVIRGIHVSS